MPRSSGSLRLEKICDQFEQPRGAGGVVVGARVHLADLRRRQRTLVAEAQVVVVSSEDHVFLRLARQIAGEVVHRGMIALDVHLERHLDVIRQRKRGGRRLGIDLLLQAGDGLAGRSQPLVGDRVLDLRDQDPRVLGTGDAAEAHERVFLSRLRFAVDQDDRLRPVIARVDRLRHELRVMGERFLLAPGLLLEARRFQAHHQHDLVLHVEVLVVVVVEIGSGDAVARRRPPGPALRRSKRS